MTLLLSKTIASQSETMADLLERLGGIAPSRIRLHPPLGMATEADVAAIEANENRLFELVDGVLVEKVMGFHESLIAVLIATELNGFILPRRLGVVSGADGMMKLFRGVVRIPDVAFVSRDRLPGGKVPTDPVPQLAPDLVVEVLSLANTVAEMDRKLQEYFEAGVRLVWLIDPESRTAKVYTSFSQEPTTLSESQSLDGGDVLPGFRLALRTLFTDLP